MTTKAKRKPAPKAKAKASDDNIVTLRQLCAHYKIDPYDARVKLRAAVGKGTIKHEARASWEWAKGDATLPDVRKILSE